MLKTNKTIIFAPEFEKKLKELRIKTAFIEELRKSQVLNAKTLAEKVKEVNRECTWEMLIMYSLQWALCKERRGLSGSDFWYAAYCKIKVP